MTARISEFAPAADTTRPRNKPETVKDTKFHEAATLVYLSVLRG